MARQRRGGGFKPPELRGTLGTLLRTAAAQVGPLRDALERTARTGLREGRSRLGDALSSRRRTDALADLGEIVLDLIRRGEIDPAELPEIQDIVAHLDELDSGHPDEDDAPPPPPPPRNAPPAARARFDSRRGGASDEEGTVSARSWRAPTSPGHAKPARVWRPPIDDAPPPSPVDDAPPHRAPRKDPTRKGGITFEDDDDLADYMHPDDVPKKPSGGDS